MIGCGREAVMFIQENAGLYLSYGEQENKEFLRVNTACKRSEPNELLSLLKDGVIAYEKFCVERC